MNIDKRTVKSFIICLVLDIAAMIAAFSYIDNNHVGGYGNIAILIRGLTPLVIMLELQLIVGVILFFRPTKTDIGLGLSISAITTGVFLIFWLNH